MFVSTLPSLSLATLPEGGSNRSIENAEYAPV